MARELLPGPLAGAAVAAGLAAPASGAAEAAVVSFLAVLFGVVLMDRRSRHARLLPFMGAVRRATGPLLGASLLFVPEALVAMPGLGAGIALVGLAGGGVTLAADLLRVRSAAPARRVRVAVIGDSGAADGLARELEATRNRDYDVRGWISGPGARPTQAGHDVQRLGSLEHLRAIVEEHGIELLLMTADTPRLQVFDEISRSCLHLPVRLQELAGFYEDVFGHVPVAEINAAWFQYIMHPRYRSASPVAQRAVDVVLSAAALVVVAPLVAVVALLVRRDGGPAFFSQLRVGEGGRPFKIWKLRTMAVGSGGTWAVAEDPRVTRVGRLLRRTHLDELPQLYNVLVGEMSLVGPRPEQPAFVERLERTVPFYSRRHLVKPGLTGWAQVRCGYAGSDVGSAWKVSHDLYYLKHRSFGLNLMILGETLRTVVADRQYAAEPASLAFIQRPEWPSLDGAASDWTAAPLPVADSA